MMIEAVANSNSRDAARANIEVNSEFDLAYLAMNGLTTIVACYGLFENSPAVVIGAMIIAMLLGPISGVALGLVDQNNQLLRKAFWTLAGGCRGSLCSCFRTLGDSSRLSLDRMKSILERLLISWI